MSDERWDNLDKSSRKQHLFIKIKYYLLNCVLYEN